MMMLMTKMVRTMPPHPGIPARTTIIYACVIECWHNWHIRVNGKRVAVAWVVGVVVVHSAPPIMIRTTITIMRKWTKEMMSNIHCWGWNKMFLWMAVRGCPIVMISSLEGTTMTSKITMQEHQQLQKQQKASNK